MLFTEAAQKDEFLKCGVPVKNILVEVGSAANKIQNCPAFYHLIDNELKKKWFITSYENWSM